jgi:hypothetical protein
VTGNVRSSMRRHLGERRFVVRGRRSPKSTRPSFHSCNDRARWNFVRLHSRLASARGVCAAILTEPRGVALRKILAAPLILHIRRAASAILNSSSSGIFRSCSRKSRNRLVEFVGRGERSGSHECMGLIHELCERLVFREDRIHIQGSQLLLRRLCVKRVENNRTLGNQFPEHGSGL